MGLQAPHEILQGWILSPAPWMDKYLAIAKAGDRLARENTAENDLGVLENSELNMIQQPGLAAVQANSTLGSINSSTASRLRAVIMSCCSAHTGSPGILCPLLGTPAQRRLSSWEIQQRMTTMVMGLKQLPYEEKLRKTYSAWKRLRRPNNSLSVPKRRLPRRQSPAVYQGVLWGN